MADINEAIKQVTEIVTPFDELEYEALLGEIQGNILKSHGRNHAVHLFLKFTGDPESVKQWIGNFSHKYVTSALAQAEQAKQHRQYEGEGQLFGNFFLTRAGYMYLGYNYEDLPNENPFRQGMKDTNIQNELGDDVEQWEDSFQQEIHALVLLAGDKIVGPRTQEAKLLERKNPELLHKQPALLAQQVEKIKTELANIATVAHEDIGYVLRSSETGAEMEHFGFRDGVSQPLFLKADIDKEKENSDFSKWDPSAPLNLVLFKDPLGKKDESYGSFLVYRKLEQNVKAWNKDVVNNLAEKLEASPDLAGAYTMGRFQDGTPVVLQNTESSQQPEENNFNYAEDNEGLKCPFHAHTRKVNPRGETPVPLEEEKMHRIVRRGINYGPLPSEEPETGAGLLFLCFQASLSNQFNFMQKAWAKERNFVRRDVGTDVVIGVEKKEKDNNGNLVAVTETYQWSTNWGESGQTEADFTHWVTMKGGEYFFAPCMSFLKSFAPAPTCNIVFRGVPKQELQAAQNIIDELRNYQQRNWGIGLNGETSEPDGFLRFFEQRNLPFKFYVRSSQVEIGDPSAYEEDIATLNKYIEDVRNQEIEASEYKIAELKEYKELYWAIGLNGDTLEPDGFVSFFGERELPFKFFVRSVVAVGDESAYEQNIATLNNYISSLCG
ncbi:Dyp-type peroxidase [Coleofasciculus sp.]|uniref:Dyp-type peroxidase n=1 Tax=Coleofasciculus sp. TaxID=3100458 RepID=UPI0039FAA7B9